MSYFDSWEFRLRQLWGEMAWSKSLFIDAENPFECGDCAMAFPTEDEMHAHRRDCIVVFMHNMEDEELESR